MAQKETRYRRCDPVQKKYSVERLGDNEEAKERQPAFARRMKIKDNSEHIQPVLKSPVLYFVEIVSDLFACKWQIFTLWWGRFVPFFLSSSSSTVFSLFLHWKSTKVYGMTMGIESKIAQS